MKDNTEYQIYIGCNDSQLRDEIISEDELRAMIVYFFKKKKGEYKPLLQYINNNQFFALYLT